MGGGHPHRPEKADCGQEHCPENHPYRFGLFASADYLARFTPIITMNDLAGHRFVGSIDVLLYDQQLSFWEEFSPDLPTSFRSSTSIAQMQALKAGAGIGVLPHFMAHTEPGLVSVLPQEYIEREFWLQVNPDSRQLARVRATIDCIVDQIEANTALFLTLPATPHLRPDLIPCKTKNKGPWSCRREFCPHSPAPFPGAWD
nr:LysR substrate-binding domain-containing protein [uncultured Desulfobulbus sp.]